MNKLLASVHSIESKEKNRETGQWEPLVTIVFTMEDRSFQDVTLGLQGMSALIKELEKIQEKMIEETEVDREKLVGVVARGWSTSKNENKIVDPDLVEGIVDHLISSGVFN